MNHFEIHTGNVLDILPTLPAESVHCVVTSPPYFGLRDYGTAQWIGGDEICDHKASELRRGANLAQSAASTRGGAKKIAEVDAIQFKDICAKCGAARADKQIGLEKIPDCLAWARREPPCDECFVCAMRRVFAEVWRVLRRDGVCWVNLGDSYANDTKWGGKSGVKNYTSALGGIPRKKQSTGLKPKDLMLIPARVALALQSDGWTLRQDIVWAKPNPMPESISDRCTKAHEFIFLFSKSPKYFYDAEAIKEPCSENTNLRISKRFILDDTPRQEIPLTSIKTLQGDENFGVKNNSRFARGTCFPVSRRNKRSVWTVATKSYKEAHFATFPPDLIKPCILAGTSEHGACADCGAPYERIKERALPSRESDRPQTRRAFELADEHNLTQKHFEAIRSIGIQGAGRAKINYTGAGNNAEDIQKLADEAKEALGGYFREFLLGEEETTGWQKTCACQTDEIKPCVVMDIFSGSATTGEVALQNRRDYQGIELNPDYVALSHKRLSSIQVKLF